MPELTNMECKIWVGKVCFSSRSFHAVITDPPCIHTLSRNLSIMGSNGIQIDTTALKYTASASLVLAAKILFTMMSQVCSLKQLYSTSTSWTWDSIRRNLAIVSIHLFPFIWNQGKARFVAGHRPPEDEMLVPRAGSQSFDGSAQLAKKGDGPEIMKRQLNEKRWTRIVANDLENIPIGLILSWGGLLCGRSQVLHGYLVLGFAASRYTHTASGRFNEKSESALWMLF